MGEGGKAVITWQGNGLSYNGILNGNFNESVKISLRYPYLVYLSTDPIVHLIKLKGVIILPRVNPRYFFHMFIFIEDQFFLKYPWKNDHNF